MEENEEANFERKRLLLQFINLPPSFHQVRSFPSSLLHPSTIVEAYRQDLVYAKSWGELCIPLPHLLEVR